MNTPFSPRMSTWDIPHVPPTPEAADSQPAGNETPSAAGENNSPVQGSLGPLPFPPEDAASGPSTAQVRFLNAVTDHGSPLRIMAGNRLLSSSLSPLALSEYFSVAAGFRDFALYDAQYPWMLLYRASLPLSAGDVVTLAVVRSGGGLDFVRVDDRPCGVRGTDFACFRCVDLVRDSPGLDLILTDGRVVFTDVRFKEVTNFRRAKPGRYDLYLAQTPPVLPSPSTDIETVEEMPVILPEPFLPGYGGIEPLTSLFFEPRAGSQNTLYLMGVWENPLDLRFRAVENF